MNKHYKNEKIIRCKDTGEICKGYRNYLKSKNWKNIRKELIDKDTVCTKCGAKKNLQIHHKTYKRIGKENIMKDLLVLCDKCHLREHKKLKFIKKKKKECNKRRKMWKDINSIEKIIK